jgi:hypothetical protein
VAAQPPPGALVAPSPQRNRGPIVEVLRGVLPASGVVLEVASGTGQHIVHFARELPALRWIPSDPDEASRGSIVAWASAEARGNIDAPLALDVLGAGWPPAMSVDAIVCINMIHIAPWPATRALFAGAARMVSGSGPVYLYGPFRVGGLHTAPSNEDFDRWLQARDPRSGVRDLEQVQAQASAEGFELSETIAMPANNLSVVFRRTRPG